MEPLELAALTKLKQDATGIGNLLGIWADRMTESGEHVATMLQGRAGTG